jgi:hypothetical protein
LKIDVYSHGFSVTELNTAQEKKALEQFCTPLILFEEKTFEGGITRMVPSKTFAASNAGRDYYRFHVNLLREFQQMVAYCQIKRDDVQITRHPVVIDDSFRVEFVEAKLHPPRDYQEEIIEYNLADGPNKVITLQAGGGKAQPLNAKIRVPGGWSTMGDMKVGSVVTAADGTPTTVTGIFPQGEQQIYKISFADGRVVEATGDHLWRVYYDNTTKARQWRICTTLEMWRLRQMNPRVFIELIEPEEGEEKDLLIEPWLMGLLLGDGTFTHTTVGFSSPDQFIIDEVQKHLPPQLSVQHAGGVDYRITRGRYPDVKHDVLDALKKYRLMGCRSWEKIVPDEYLEGSRSQRLALVQGMIDSDGYVRPNGSVSYSTSSLQLANDLQYLIRSLGGIASISVKEPTYSYLGEVHQGRTSYSVNIRYKNPTELCRLPKKKERTKEDYQYGATLKLRVDNVEPSRMAEAQCISIDHPTHLYVTDDFVVTHNTLLAQHTMKRLGYRTSIMMKGGYLDQWVSSLDIAFKFGRGDLVKIQGSIALHTIMQMAIDGDELPMCMLISINTFSEYIREYERNGVTQMYPIAPHEFFEVMKIGLNIFDEGHQFPHQVMKLFVYTHIEKFMTLSATLETRNKFMNRIYEIMYPRCDRFDAGYRKVYISASAVFWQLKDSKSIRYTGYKGAYSHVKFEESMMLSKNRKILANYVDMICAFADSEFISVMEKGQKMLIFCATVKFCTMLVKEIQKRYPHMDTTRYVSADKRTVMDKADIIVSTVLSAGTAVDIPNLRVTWMTTAIDSQQANEQALYRTRPLVDWPDQVPRFIYSVCSTIEKHVKYHLNKVSAWKLLVKEHGRLQSPISV